MHQELVFLHRQQRAHLPEVGGQGFDVVEAVQALMPILVTVEAPPVNDDVLVVDARGKIAHQAFHDGPYQFKSALVLEFPEAPGGFGCQGVDALLEQQTVSFQTPQDVSGPALLMRRAKYHSLRRFFASNIGALPHGSREHFPQKSVAVLPGRDPSRSVNSLTAVTHHRGRPGWPDQAISI